MKFAKDRTMSLICRLGYDTINHTVDSSSPRINTTVTLPLVCAPPALLSMAAPTAERRPRGPLVSGER